jgi:hypothetical protein
MSKSMHDYDLMLDGIIVDFLTEPLFKLGGDDPPPPHIQMLDFLRRGLSFIIEDPPELRERLKLWMHNLETLIKDPEVFALVKKCKKKKARAKLDKLLRALWDETHVAATN